MEKICEVSNPEIALKQLKNTMEMRLICIYLLLKTKNTWYSMKRVRKYILEVCFIRIIPSIKIKNEGRILGIETEDGKMPINLHLLIYHIICYGNQNIGFASSMNLFSGLSLKLLTIIFPPRFTCRNPFPYFLSPYTFSPSKISGLC